MARVLAIVGPTASGKSDLALSLAARHHAELISVDSRQVYRDLAVGTAKPMGQWREGTYWVQNTPYHLLDVWDPGEIFTAAHFVRLAQERLQDLRARGKKFIFVGGTGLYFKALSEGLAAMPPADAAVRSELSQIAEQKGRVYLHEQLRVVDPESAGKIPANNIQRVMRALEVYRVTGKPISQWHKEHRSTPPAADSLQRLTLRYVGLHKSKEELHNRIEERCVAMVDNGMIEEVQALLAKNYAATCPGFSSVGYPQVLRFLRGELTKDQMLDEMILKTRQYAKRQMTWFRHQTHVEWLTDSAARAL